MTVRRNFLDNPETRNRIITIAGLTVAIIGIFKIVMAVKDYIASLTPAV